MTTKRVCLFTACAFLAIASTSLGDTRTQDFSVDPGWTTLGSGANGNNFGYQASFV